MGVLQTLWGLRRIALFLQVGKLRVFIVRSSCQLGCDSRSTFFSRPERWVGAQAQNEWVMRAAVKGAPIGSLLVVQKRMVASRIYV